MILYIPAVNIEMKQKFDDSNENDEEEQDSGMGKRSDTCVKTNFDRFEIVRSVRGNLGVLCELRLTGR